MLIEPHGVAALHNEGDVIEDEDSFIIPGAFYVTADRVGDLAIHCRKIDASPIWTTHMYGRSAGYG
jgi:hypothetical protein